MNRILSILVVVAGCLLPFAATAGEINLFVAASLKEVVNELADSYAKHNSGITFMKNYGASGALAKQIENGAPADIFISANLEWMEYMKTRKLADRQEHRYLCLQLPGIRRPAGVRPPAPRPGGKDRHRQPHECSCRGIRRRGIQEGGDRQAA